MGRSKRHRERSSSRSRTRERSRSRHVSRSHRDDFEARLCRMENLMGRLVDGTSTAREEHRPQGSSLPSGREVNSPLATFQPGSTLDTEGAVTPATLQATRDRSMRSNKDRSMQSNKDRSMRANKDRSMRSSTFLDEGSPTADQSCARSPRSAAEAASEVEEDVISLEGHDDAFVDAVGADRQRVPTPLHTEEDITSGFLSSIGITQESSTAPVLEIPHGLLLPWKDVMMGGLDKDQRLKLVSLYDTTESASLAGFAAPLINEEIKSAIKKDVLAMDSRITITQRRLLSSLAAQAVAIKSIATIPDTMAEQRQALGMTLADVGKFTTDAIHSLSIVRRDLLYPCLSKSVKEATFRTRPGRYLFGETVIEDLKKQKSLESLSKEIKASVVKGRSFRPPPSKQPPASTPAVVGQTQSRQPRHSAQPNLNSRSPVRQRGGARPSGQPRGYVNRSMRR